MKYVSTDLETTGLDPRVCQPLQIAMVLEDTEQAADTPVEYLPHIQLLVRNPILSGDYYAMMVLNKDLIERCHDEGLDVPKAWWLITEWLSDHGFAPSKDRRANMAGKNVGNFDMRFMPTQVLSYFRHRTIDPGSKFIDWNAHAPPSLGTLLQQRDPEAVVTHDALQDARDVITVLRRDYVG